MPLTGTEQPVPTALVGKLHSCKKGKLPSASLPHAGGEITAGTSTSAPCRREAPLGLRPCGPLELWSWDTVPAGLTADSQVRHAVLLVVQVATAFIQLLRGC